jgi:LytS/YehU family sensor histidine kinase
MEATYQQLKQQVNPHFLFNSLNTLKTLIRKQPDNAEIYLNKLSAFLRKSIEYDQMSVITLEEELNFCMNYIDLQKVRFGDALQFVMDISEEAKTGFVPVFSVQQLLENAIKHNALTQESPLFICLKMSSNRLIVSNNIQEKITRDESTGIGLVNLTERYQLLSGDEVIITQADGAFSVSLKILSHEDCNYRR